MQIFFLKEKHVKEVVRSLNSQLGAHFIAAAVVVIPIVSTGAAAVAGAVVVISSKYLIPLKILIE